jgi:GH15 family glucan-1,4-alpha-glucosidase
MKASGKRAVVASTLFIRSLCAGCSDRGLRLADKRSFPAERTRWLEVRDQIYEEIMSKGWSESRQAFVQAYGSEDLDASNLLMPLVFFSSPTDPKMIKTLEAIMRSPSKGRPRHAWPGLSLSAPAGGRDVR